MGVGRLPTEIDSLYLKSFLYEMNPYAQQSRSRTSVMSRTVCFQYVSMNMDRIFGDMNFVYIWETFCIYFDMRIYCYTEWLYDWSNQAFLSIFSSILISITFGLYFLLLCSFLGNVVVLLSNDITLLGKHVERWIGQLM